MRVRSKLAWTLVLAVLFGGCARRAARGERPVELSPMRLLPLTEPTRSWAEQLDEEENRFALNLLGISAADDQHVFVHGNLRHGGASIRSLLLQSDDGGLTFREVMAPYESSEVTHLAFAGCVGWALVGWRQEEPGDLTVVGTADCGKLWFALSELPKSDPSGWPVGMKLEEDTVTGTITLAYDDPDVPRAHFHTRDGGRTWVEVPARPTAAEPPRIQRVFTAPGGVQWKLDLDGDRYVIRRRANSNELWTPAAVLPVCVNGDPLGACPH